MATKVDSPYEIPEKNMLKVENQVLNKRILKFKAMRLFRKV
jgi:hypothetical protein